MYHRCVENTANKNEKKEINSKGSKENYENMFIANTASVKSEDFFLIDFDVIWTVLQR